MALAVYGGSFDPPHVGHVLAAHYVLSIGAASEVMIVPVFEHALHKPLSSFELRCRMCEQAFAREDRITVSRVEQSLPRPSYTLRTLQEIKRSCPEQDLRLMVGADVLLDSHKWHRFGEVVELAPLLVLGRRGVSHPDSPLPLLPEVSSSEVRELVRRSSHNAELEGKGALAQLVPADVLKTIFDESLYR